MKFSNGLLHLNIAALTDQQKITFISSGQILDAVKKTYLGQWSIGTNGKKESNEFVPFVCLDDEENDYLEITSLNKTQASNYKLVHRSIKICIRNEFLKIPSLNLALKNPENFWYEQTKRVLTSDKPLKNCLIYPSLI